MHFWPALKDVILFWYGMLILNEKFEEVACNDPLKKGLIYIHMYIYFVFGLGYNDNLRLNISVVLIIRFFWIEFKKIKGRAKWGLVMLFSE